MTRIEEVFRKLRQKKEKALVTYITVGDPDIATTAALLQCLVGSGADIIELGVPFSDPMADGPTIQAASQRALRHRFSMEQVLGLVRGIRKYSEIPVVLFSYYNPLYQYGLERLARDARSAGVDGVLVVDLPPEEAGPLHEAARGQGLDTIFLLAPTSTPERMRIVSRMASGFIYYVSVTGVTGARESIAGMMDRAVARIRKYSSLPVGIGFGIARPEHVRSIARYADAIIVGSAIIKQMEAHMGKPDMLEHVGKFVRSLKRATRI